MLPTQQDTTINEYNTSIKKLNEKRDANLRAMFVGIETKEIITETLTSSFETPLNVGDQVRIINSRPNDWDKPPYWIKEMDKYMGKIGVVTKVGEDSLMSFDDVSWRYKRSWVIGNKN